MYSVIIPVYRNEESLPELVSELEKLSDTLKQRCGQITEFVFVVDGCPERSHALLHRLLPSASFPSQLILHARNFGSFAAIRTGMTAASGDYMGVIAADLQEPLDLLVSFLESLQGEECDIVVGQRESRDDPMMTRVTSGLFWKIYRSWVIPDIPPGGVDVFGCTRRVRDELLKLQEVRGSLVGQLFWLGFRRKHVGYNRQARKYGRSGWSLRRKLVYMADSIFAFTDLPIRLLSLIGGVGMLFSVIFGIVVVILRLTGGIHVPGYAALAVLVTFFSGLNLMGLGIVGTYAWRADENAKRRPLTVVQDCSQFGGSPKGEA